MSTKKKVMSIVGARPNFIKIAPLAHELDLCPDIDHMLVHTGQHYDQAMSTLFFDQLGIPKPDVNLEVGSGSHAKQTAAIMERIEPVIERERPDLMIVVGDVNSTIACAMTAVKLGVPVAHVEAGLRSFDRGMPEEINRVLTDAISEYHFVTEESGRENLLREGVPESGIHFVGNLMIDTLLKQREKAAESKILEELGVAARGYGLVTLHRPSNVDSPDVLRGLFGALSKIAEEIELLFPCHPRTRARIEEYGFTASLGDRIRLCPPIGYLDFIRLVADARFVLTDSGGIQEETTILRVPCLTMRENTERPVTITEGSNVLVGTDPEKILAEAARVLKGEFEPSRSAPKYWDGKAAERIVEALVSTVLA